MDIEIIAVGGYNEVGRNMSAVRCGKEIVIFDMTLEIELGCTGGEEDGVDNSHMEE